jgi:hypothetical protein
MHEKTITLLILLETLTYPKPSTTKSWEIIGIPYFLQLDDQLSFRGSNRDPRSFGRVVRLCLLLGVEPISIPLTEPWRNGCMEKFQDTFEHRFFRRIVFPDNFS